MSDEKGITQAEFARRLGVSRAYITRLKQAGRLVMDGKRVLPEATIQRLHDTADPNRDDVVRRHAAYRAARGDISVDGGHTPRGRSEPATSATSGAPGADLDRAGSTYQQARAVKERYAALQAKADYERSIGRLVEIDEVRHAAAHIATAVRVSLEGLPDQIAPELASITDAAQAHALLVERIEDLLRELAGQADIYMHELEAAE